MNRFDALEELRSYMSDTEILDELVRAMGDFEATEKDGGGYLGYIAQNNGIDLTDED